MNTATLLLNLDVAAGVTALVAIGMIAVPNIERIRALRRVLSRRPLRSARERRLTPNGGIGTLWRAG